jgi:hypothetical protein
LPKPAIKHSNERKACPDKEEEEGAELGNLRLLPVHSRLGIKELNYVKKL